MAEPTSAIHDISQEEIEKQIEEIEYIERQYGPRLAVVVGVIAAQFEYDRHGFESYLGNVG